MRDMKKFTAFELRKAILSNERERRKDWMLNLMKKAGEQNANPRNFQLWLEGNHPIELNYPTIMHQKLDYIHDNPVEAGIVEEPEKYLYSSARDYYGDKGLLDIIILDPLQK